MHQKDVYFPPLVHIEYPLQNAAKIALKDVTDPTHELRKATFERSLEKGVLPYEVTIDALPYAEPSKTKRKHAYITFSRLMKHGFTKGCSGCSLGTYNHPQTCRDKFDGLYPKEVVRTEEAQPSGAITSSTAHAGPGGNTPTPTTPVPHWPSSVTVGHRDLTEREDLQ